MTSRRVRLAAAWLAVLAWAGLIFALSATPNLQFSPSSDVDFVVRKVGHAGVFGILAVLAWRAISYSQARRASMVALAFTVAYAASDEFHQSFTVGRHPSLVDVGIDTVGAGMALLALAVFLRLRARRSAGSETAS